MTKNFGFSLLGVVLAVVRRWCDYAYLVKGKSSVQNFCRNLPEIPFFPTQGTPERNGREIKYVCSKLQMYLYGKKKILLQGKLLPIIS